MNFLNKTFSNRVVVQANLKDSLSIEELQKDIEKSLGNEFSSYNSERLHLTLFHFGIINEVYDEISKILPENKKIDFQNFLHLVADLFSKVEKINVAPFTLWPDKLDIFGSPEGKKLVLCYKMSDELDRLNKLLCNHFEEWLSTLGVESPADNLCKIVNFKNNCSKNYKPHVTLGSIVDKDISIDFIKTKISFKPNFNTVFSLVYVKNLDKVYLPQDK